MADRPSLFDIKYQNMNQEETLLNYERDMMLWEQTEALNKANELAEQRLQKEKELEYKELEKDREYLENLREIEDKKISFENEIEQNRMSHDELMRYYRLCDDMGLNYDDIEKLDMWLENPTNEQINKCSVIDKKYREIFETDEIASLHYERIKKEEEYEIAKEENDRETEELMSTFYKSADELYSEDYINVTGLDNISGGTEEELKKLINENISVIKTLRAFLFFIICVAIPLCLTGIFVIAIGIGIFLGLIILDRIVRLKNGIKIMEKAVSEHQEKVSKKKQERQDIAIKCDKLKDELDEINKKILMLERNRENDLKDNMEYLNIKKERDILYDSVVKRNGTLNQKEFDEFRKNHFNDDVERLFRKLGLKNIRKIQNDEILNYGKIEDYRDFIEDKVLNIDDLYFEDYEAYFIKGQNERISKSLKNSNI